MSKPRNQKSPNSTHPSRSAKPSPLSGIVTRVSRTLLTNSYVIDAFERPANGAFLYEIRRRDTLGGEARTVVLFTEKTGSALMQRLLKQAQHYRGTPLVVFRNKVSPTPVSVLALTELEFFKRLGGEIRTDRIFTPKLPAILNALGHGRVPTPLHGDADTLLEEYIQDCWSYLLDCPVRRFGQDRAFERLPDGLCLGRNRLNVGFDGKAYSGGFHPSTKDMRAFEEYVRDFNNRYEPLVGRISVFVVVSGSFPKSTAALTAKANELISSAGTPMVFVRAKDLAIAVEQVRSVAHRRVAINWSKILVPPIFELRSLQTELRRIARDSIG